MSITTRIIRKTTSRSLTTGEITMAKLVFKNSIDYGKVKIIRGGLLGMPNLSNNAMTPFGDIHFSDNTYDKIKDFSQRENDYKILFIHEMAHVWQRTMGISVAGCGLTIGITGGYFLWDAYDYGLSAQDKNKKFSQFNIEQQASMIAEYYAIRYLKINPKNRTDAQKNVLLNILKPFIANPAHRGIITSY
ncbi:MAG: zinc protease [Moraxella sp.]|nr:zinc protease [Moraxella sp.]